MVLSISRKSNKGNHGFNMTKTNSASGFKYRTQEGGLNCYSVFTTMVK
jgi:hypothetical protein